MDIAAMSVALSTSQVKSDANLAVMKKAMDVFEGQNAELTDMLQDMSATAPHPTAGHHIDQKA
ncbi:MAG TPA: YjfB family protein [Candidatus Avamphibacillus intestinigallinarum]|nr:YjfB family protein [Candidatus Avamphibacillus intestinigallinarum]